MLLANSSELVMRAFNKARSLIEPLRSIELVSLSRPDECCGFGGAFSTFEEAVSSLMGQDRMADHLRAGAEIIAGYDSSCLMHLEGIIKRQKAPLRVMHIASFIPDIGESTIDCSKIERPHEQKGLDLVILPGEFGVAENAAVWVAGNALGRQRVVFVIAQHLVLVVRADEIVNNMQEAYARVRLENYGLFISGPSKTADIEQALAIGAHGARSCTVFVIG
jgi:hypothetical protein